MTEQAQVEFGYDPDPSNPGWMIWGPRYNGQFNTLYNPIMVQEEGPGKARVRFHPQRLLTSVTGNMHGGAIAGFIDIALFAGARGCGVVSPGAPVTIDLSIQYVAPGLADRPMDAVIDLLRETGRMAFLRGVVEQDTGTVASFLGTIRKGSPAR